MTLTMDPDLVEGARAGGQGMERLIAAVWPDAFRIALGILHDRDLAQDAAQEACASIARSLETLEHPGAFRSWCYKIIANRALKIARKRPTTIDLDALESSTISSDSSDVIDLRKAIGALPLEQRAVVLLHYYCGFNSSEIAEAIGARPSTVRFRLMLARRTLHQSLTLSPEQAPLMEALL